MPARPRLTLIQLLRRGHRRILRGWTQHTPACDNRGIPCRADDPAAVAWCVVGAANYRDDDHPNPNTDPCCALMRQALAELRKSLAELVPHENHGGYLNPWNDMRERTQADAAGLYEHAIARLERQDHALSRTDPRVWRPR